LFVIADRDYHPDPTRLCQELPDEHIQWHIWQRTEIENYLLHLPALVRLLGGREEQPSFDEMLLAQEFRRLIESSRNAANDRLVQAFDELRRRDRQQWDAATMARKAREHLDEHWEADKVALADAKDVVLPGLKRWLQDNDIGQFSNRKLAETLRADELAEEVHELARSLARFAGVES